ELGPSGRDRGCRAPARGAHRLPPGRGRGAPGAGRGRRGRQPAGARLPQPALRPPLHRRPRGEPGRRRAAVEAGRVAVGVTVEGSAGRAAARARGARALLGSGALISTAVAVANALNAAFQFALARILEPAKYSLLAALFTVVLISQVPTLGLQASGAREI